MITLITGKTGTGKSFLATKLILEYCSQKKVFTNIKFFDNCEIDNYYHVETEEIFDKISLISKKCSELSIEDLSKSLANEDYYNSVLVVDEVQYYNTRKFSHDFNVFLSVHRHLKMDIVLITQVKTNLHRDYLPYVHKHYHAKSSKKITTMLEYSIYDSVGGDFVGITTVSPKKYSKIYQAGAVENSFNYFDNLKLLGILIVLIILGYNLYGKWGDIKNSSSFSKKIETNSSVVKIKDNNFSIVTECNVHEGLFSSSFPPQSVCEPFGSAKRCVYVVCK